MKERNEIAMTPQQKRVRSAGLDTYREILVGDRGWGYLAGYELYNLFFSSLAGLSGLASRAFLLPFFLRGCGTRAVFGRDVSIIQPSRVSIGSYVVLEDDVLLDVRSNFSAPDHPGIEIGDNCFIGRSSMLKAKGGYIKLGNACNISSYCRIGTQSKLEIGNSVLISAYCYIGPGNHQPSGQGKSLIEKEMDIKGGVKIGDHAWIGARVTILDGVTVGDGAIIGAHSLVREDVPAGAVAVGIPARVIRQL